MTKNWEALARFQQRAEDDMYVNQLVEELIDENVQLRKQVDALQQLADHSVNQATKNINDTLRVISDMSKLSSAVHEGACHARIATVEDPEIRAAIQDYNEALVSGDPQTIADIWTFHLLPKLTERLS